MSGKGDTPRPVGDLAKFNDNFDRIFKQGKYSDAEQQATSIPDQEPGEQSPADTAESESSSDGGETQLQE